MANKNREFFVFFFRKNFLSVDFAQFYYLNQLNIFEKQPQLIALSSHVRRFRKFSAWAIILASKT